MCQTLLSVILVQYEPDWSKLERTLLSLLAQDDQNFELIVADDGSKVNHFAKTKSLLAHHGKTASFVLLPENKGTVWNIWNAVSHCSGKWIYGISPGDYLYDKGVIRWLKSVCAKDHPHAGFGKAAYYAETPSPHCLPGQTPCDRNCYRQDHYKFSTVKRHLILYDDGISGACAFYKRDVFLAALSKMKGRVLYAEDFALRMLAAQNIQLYCYDRVICWYESSSGVSLSKDKMRKDWQEMLLLLRELYPKDWIIKLAILYFFNEKRKSRVLRGLIGHLIVPQWIPFKQKQRKYSAPINGDISRLEQLYALHEEEEKNGSEDSFY